MKALSPSARKVQEVLRERGFGHLEVFEHTRSTRTAQEAAEAVGQIVKWLIFRGVQSGKPYLLLVSGPNRVHEAERADPDFVREVTGFVIGGVSRHAARGPHRPRPVATRPHLGRCRYTQRGVWPHPRRAAAAHRRPHCADEVRRAPPRPTLKRRFWGISYPQMLGFFRRADPYVKPQGPNAFLVRVRTHKSGEVVELRLTKGSEISPDESGYYVRKAIIAPKSLDRAVLEIWFDRGYRPTRKSVEGGELVPIQEWE